ncbi:MAG: protein-disulfide reductase DsbD [Epsilonproteobacteria bacterium]|nr:protein-disulfide reductase DsbD [Campylobacterota bacterium]
MKKLLLLVTLFTLSLNAQFLMPDQAFKPYAKVNENSQIEAGVTIAKDIYLYAGKFHVELVDANNIKIIDTKKPSTTKHHGEDVYLTSPKFILTLQASDNAAKVENIKLKISYQGCSDQGLCYEPYTKEFELQIDTTKLQASQQKSSQQKSETDAIADTIKNSNLLVIIATFFIFGLLLSLTPCVFPMIPIISGVIIAQGKGITTKKAFALSLTYVLAMAVAYTIAGVLAGLFGANLQATLQSPWAVYTFAAVFVALALSMFGYYELKLPDALVSKVSQNSSKSGFIGVAIMGFLSALIVGPCVAAPLAGALVYIGQTGDALLGAVALFSMSIGMGVLLIVVGVSAGKFMPKPGGWMTMVNAFFGALMLAVAIWMLDKVVPQSVTITLYAILGMGFALYLHPLDAQSHILKRTIGSVLFIYALALFISVLAGKPNLTKPLGFLQSTQKVTAAKEELSFQKVTSLKQLDAILEQNKGKKIMLDFAANWCVACKELEEVTFADKRVIDALQDYVLIRADITANDADAKALSQKFHVFGPPAIIFFDPSLDVIKSKTIVGFIDPDTFLQHIN